MAAESESAPSMQQCVDRPTRRLYRSCTRLVWTSELPKPADRTETESRRHPLGRVVCPRSAVEEMPPSGPHQRRPLGRHCRGMTLAAIAETRPHAGLGAAPAIARRVADGDDKSIADGHDPGSENAREQVTPLLGTPVAGVGILQGPTLVGVRVKSVGSGAASAIAATLRGRSSVTSAPRARLKRARVVARTRSGPCMRPRASVAHASRSRSAADPDRWRQTAPSCRQLVCERCVWADVVHGFAASIRYS